MLLLERVQNVHARLRKAEAARSGVTAAHELSDLRSQLISKQEMLQAMVSQIKLLRKNGVTISAFLELQTCKERLDTIATKFLQVPTAVTLRTGQNWRGLMSALESLINKSSAVLMRNWKEYYLNKLFSGLPPANQKARLAKTPKNTAALQQYADLFNRLLEFKDRLPKSQDEFKELHSCSEKLTKITKTGFDEEVPDDVAKFLGAIAETGAGLKLLTPEVNKWLQENKLLDKYVVRARID